MPLSLSKLEEILETKNFIIKKLFVIKQECVFIEIINIITADSCLIYIPSKYTMYEDNRDNIFDIETLDVDSDGNIAEKYSEQPSVFDLERDYTEIELESTKKGNMEEYLEEKYNYPIDFNEIIKKDLPDIRENFRQLKRLKFTVQNINYKLAIIYKNYICTIKRDNTLDGFVIKNHDKSTDKQLLVCIDLESLYTKIDSLAEDIKVIKENITNILDINQNKHIENLKKMVEKTAYLSSISQKIYHKKLEYKNQLLQLNKLLEKLLENETILSEKMLQISNRYSDKENKTIHDDIEKSQELSVYNNKLRKVNELKQEIIKTAISIKEKYEKLTLKVDSVFFDSSIMINTIIKNVTLLENI